MSSHRAYRSELREEQARQTRESIIEATVRLLTQERPPAVSVPEIAAEAGVGIATVYRYFPSKDDVFDAVYDRWMAGARALLADEPHRDLETFLAVLPELWRRQSENQALADALSSYSPVGRQVRRRRRRRRRAVAARLLASTAVADSERERLEPLVLLLTSTAAHKHLREHWDLDTDGAAELAAWAVRTLVAAVERR